MTVTYLGVHKIHQLIFFSNFTVSNRPQFYYVLFVKSGSKFSKNSMSWQHWNLNLADSYLWKFLHRVNDSLIRTNFHIYIYKICKQWTGSGRSDFFFTFFFWWPSEITAPTDTECMMTSSKGNTFRVTALLWGEFTGHRWIPLTKVSESELWCVLWSAPEQTLSKRWANHRDAGDLRRHRAHYDVTRMGPLCIHEENLRNIQWIIHYSIRNLKRYGYYMAI